MLLDGAHCIIATWSNVRILVPSLSSQLIIFLTWLLARELLSLLFLLLLPDLTLCMFEVD